MKLVFFIFSLSTLILSAAPPSLQAQIFSKKPSGTSLLDAEAGLVSDFFFRGQRLSDSLTLAPRIRGTGVTDSGQIWAEFLASIPSSESSEGDANLAQYQGALGYNFELALGDTQVGYRWFGYKDAESRGRGNTQELFTLIGFQFPLQPTMLLTYDVDRHVGWYAEASLHEDYQVDLLSQALQLTPSAKAAFQLGLSDGKNSVYSSNFLIGLEAGIEGKIKLTSDLSLKPKVSYFLAKDEAADSFGWIGTNLLYSFSSE